MTSSRPDLEAALARLSIPQKVATLLYEAIRQSAAGQMRQQKGRKAFILLTDGVAFRDGTSIGTAIEFAQMADTILYSIRFSGHAPAYRPGRAIIRGIASERGKQALERLAAETGGEALEVSRDKPIEKVFAEIEESLRNQYNIGYTPQRANESGKFHKIKLTVNDRTLTVQSRAGYYSR
jgi:VWFA-related protein